MTCILCPCPFERNESHLYFHIIPKKSVARCTPPPPTHTHIMRTYECMVLTGATGWKPSLGATEQWVVCRGGGLPPPPPTHTQSEDTLWGGGGTRVPPTRMISSSVVLLPRVIETLPDISHSISTRLQSFSPSLGLYDYRT